MDDTQDDRQTQGYIISADPDLKNTLWVLMQGSCKQDSLRLHCLF